METDRIHAALERAKLEWDAVMKKDPRTNESPSANQVDPIITRKDVRKMSDYCPKCEIPLSVESAEYEQGFMFLPAHAHCERCDWQPGDETKLCAECEEWSEERITCHPTDDAKDDVLLCPECAKECGFVECPKCGEWDAPNVRGEHIICKWCVEELVVEYESKHKLGQHGRVSA